MNRLGGVSHSHAPLSAGTSARVRAKTAARDQASRLIESSTVALSIPVALALQFQCHFVAHKVQKTRDSVAGLSAASQITGNDKLLSYRRTSGAALNTARQ
jgi:hypothetical protein